ncbi:hypothetical protein NDU88_009509 [Pleurodeles waltl]|uniref:Uncharacterized protein n=1 Tax=Pleurodeles waltl TaxID=8319 RepID=A0AAV7QSZ4_PLEWA|nr:hypothetical protein NDU88_009509 [Pleurodeles waltl]
MAFLSRPLWRAGRHIVGTAVPWGAPMALAGPDPEVLVPSSNPERLPGEGGIRKSLIWASEAGTENVVQKEDCDVPGGGKGGSRDTEDEVGRTAHIQRLALQDFEATSGTRRRQNFLRGWEGGPGGGNAENPTTLWGERGLGRYGSTGDGTKE